MIVLLLLSYYVDIVHILYMYFPNFGGFNEINKISYNIFIVLSDT